MFVRHAGGRGRLVRTACVARSILLPPILVPANPSDSVRAWRSVRTGRPRSSTSIRFNGKLEMRNGKCVFSLLARRLLT
jgi:hypothetical protein